MYLSSENNLDFNENNVLATQSVNQNYWLKRYCYYTRQFSKLFGFMASNYETAFKSNIEILQRLKNRYLRIINAPWYIISDTLYHDFNIPYVRDEISRLSQKYTDRMEES